MRLLRVLPPYIYIPMKCMLSHLPIYNWIDQFIQIYPLYAQFNSISNPDWIELNCSEPCEKMTDFPYDSNYARNFESQILMKLISWSEYWIAVLTVFSNFINVISIFFEEVFREIFVDDLFFNFDYVFGFRSVFYLLNKFIPNSVSIKFRNMNARVRVDLAPNIHKRLFGRIVRFSVSEYYWHVRSRIL
jgi:hypothetical protein